MLLFIQDVLCAFVFCYIWDVPCAFVFLQNIGCSMCFYLYGMFHVLQFFLLNTGCSTYFCFFAKHRMFHVFLFIWDVPCALVFF